jgi:hypothetical protein
LIVPIVALALPPSVDHRSNAATNIPDMKKRYQIARSRSARMADASLLVDGMDRPKQLQSTFNDRDATQTD